MREIIFDTETTGLKPSEGHRVVEIGCIETVNRFPTGRTFHQYLNPERDMPQEAFAIHGLSSEFLKDKPRFADVADAFCAFLGDEGALVAHNATFDLGFLNAELAAVGRPLIAESRIVDTVVLARRKFPGQRVSLDALCERFGIDNSRRTKHGALLDSEILADVYVELLGGRQSALALDPLSARAGARGKGGKRVAAQRPTPLVWEVSESDLAAHAAFVAEMGKDAVWLKYAPAPDAPKVG